MPVGVVLSPSPPPKPPAASANGPRIASSGVPVGVVLSPSPPPKPPAASANGPRIVSSGVPVGVVLSPSPPPIPGIGNEPLLGGLLGSIGPRASCVQTSYTFIDVPRSADRPPPIVTRSFWKGLVAKPPMRYFAGVLVRLSGLKASVLPSKPKLSSSKAKPPLVSTPPKMSPPSVVTVMDLARLSSTRLRGTWITNDANRPAGICAGRVTSTPTLPVKAPLVNRLSAKATALFTLVKVSLLPSAAEAGD